MTRERKTEPHLKNALLRTDAEDVDALKALARYHGRSLQKELVLAAKFFISSHALAHLQRPEGQEEVRAMGLDPDAELAMVKSSLDELARVAFTRPSSPVPLRRLRESAASN